MGLEINVAIHLHYPNHYEEGTCFQLPLLSHGRPGHKLSSETKASRKTLLIMKPETKKCGNYFHYGNGSNSRSALSSAESSISNFNISVITWSTLTQKLLNCIKTPQKPQNHQPHKNPFSLLSFNCVPKDQFCTSLEKPFPISTQE